MSGGLTSAGRADMLRQLGSRMREDYQQVVTEPVPDDLERLVGELKTRERTKARDPS